MGEVRNVRIQIGYQAYLVDFLVLDILIDKELSLLLGHPFLRTCGPVIDMRCGTLSIDDGIIRHTYFLKPRAKAYLENFKIDKKDDWLSCFEVGRDEHGNHKYCPVAPSFLDIEDEMERALEMEAYFNPFKNIIVFKILIEFLGSLSVQLKNTDWGNEGYGMYKKIEGDGAWHTKFEERIFKSRTKKKAKVKQNQARNGKDKVLNLIHVCRYPLSLSVSLMKKMLKHKLEVKIDGVGNDMTYVVQLIQFIKNQLASSVPSA
ncbi:putative ribonuclease H-like domain-containing protein [Tanacetum coccineum]|uniref:Ribonuclease H-like domain-containing protein n=1 Tax=Tanacetum coccineum TaxID=301880 RepID=A0ABQ5II31_9ASTR